jgi:5-methylcytosine-specific restriction endonuclease McrA
LIRDAIGTTCRYCQGILTLENLTIDHIEPYRSSELRRNKAENKEHRRFMDRRENLQVICRKCNQIKLDLDHDQYSSLLAFLSGDEQMKDSVIRRLVMSRAPFRRR